MKIVCAHSKPALQCTTPTEPLPVRQLSVFLPIVMQLGWAKGDGHLPDHHRSPLEGLIVAVLTEGEP